MKLAKVRKLFAEVPFAREGGTIWHTCIRFGNSSHSICAAKNILNHRYRRPCLATKKCSTGCRI